MNYTVPLRQLAKSHTHVDCEKPNCLLCESGFLFRMLSDAKGVNCQASNFTRAFAAAPQGQSFCYAKHASLTSGAMK